MSLLSQNLICSKITLRKVEPYDVDFLYQLREEWLKYPKYCRLPKDQMPTKNEHFMFVSGFLVTNWDHPYKAWYIIEYDKERIGSLPLKKTNEFGYQIKKEYQGRGLIHQAFKLFFKLHPKKDLWAKTSVLNLRSQGLIKKYGFKAKYIEFH